TKFNSWHSNPSVRVDFSVVERSRNLRKSYREHPKHLLLFKILTFHVVIGNITNQKMIFRLFKKDVPGSLFVSVIGNVVQVLSVFVKVRWSRFMGKSINIFQDKGHHILNISIGSFCKGKVFFVSQEIRQVVKKG